MEVLKPFFDLHKIPAKIIFVISITTAFILFYPPLEHDQLRLLELKKETGKYVSITFLFTTSLSIINLISYCYNKLKVLIKKRKEKRKALVKDRESLEFTKYKLNNLNDNEINILRQYYKMTIPNAKTTTILNPYQRDNAYRELMKFNIIILHENGLSKISPKANEFIIKSGILEFTEEEIKRQSKIDKEV
ncbi:hypothetical protein MY04_2568 [Flammeovirga sp. MY04]|uniref:super-infection exclusion protein B n=1 Tax=Flammeovirga sp. MY04 TaxID=1191459 RepID=UPI00080609F4|nr:super-infection exclusion protein B [Flammeovirga sp. MY04]ANQ49937.1 hypothetical protein MY04_2568 [Flammeovirga sp. MY04]